MELKPIYIAGRRNDLPIAQILQKRGTTAEERLRALEHALRHDAGDVVQYLVKEDPSLYSVALKCAARVTKLEILQHLIDSKRSKMDRWDLQNALEHAAKCG